MNAFYPFILCSNEKEMNTDSTNTYSHHSMIQTELIFAHSFNIYTKFFLEKNILLFQSA